MERSTGMVLLVLLGLVSTATPAKALDRSWGVLTRSTHLHGSWTIALDDGTAITGDWVVINREVYLARDFGGGAGPAKAIYLVSSTAKTVCAFDADRPFYLYCTDRLARNVRAAGKLSLDGTTQLTGGRLTIDARPTPPSLVQEALLFERTVNYSLATQMHGTSRWDKDTLVLEVPYRDVTRWPITKRENSHVLYAQEVVNATATIRIGPSPSEVSITARQTARHVEDCSDRDHDRLPSSCMPMPPVCTRRQGSSAASDE